MGGFSYMSLERKTARGTDRLCVCVCVCVCVGICVYYVCQCIVLYLVSVWEGSVGQTSSEFIDSVLSYPPGGTITHSVSTYHTFVYFSVGVCVCNHPTWALSGAVLCCLLLTLCDSPGGSWATGIIPASLTSPEPSHQSLHCVCVCVCVCMEFGGMREHIIHIFPPLCDKMRGFVNVPKQTLPMCVCVCVHMHVYVICTFCLSKLKKI